MGLSVRYVWQLEVALCTSCSMSYYFLIPMSWLANTTDHGECLCSLPTSITDPTCDFSTSWGPMLLLVWDVSCNRKQDLMRSENSRKCSDCSRNPSLSLKTWTRGAQVTDLIQSIPQSETSTIIILCFTNTLCENHPGSLVISNFAIHTVKYRSPASNGARPNGTDI